MLKNMDLDDLSEMVFFDVSRGNKAKFSRKIFLNINAAIGSETQKKTDM